MSNRKLLFRTLSTHNFRLMVDWRFNRGVKKQTEEIHKGIFEVLNPEWLELFDERELEVGLLRKFE